MGICNHQKNSRRESGFTLVELAVALAISSLVFLILGQVLGEMHRQKDDMTARTELEQNLLLAANWLTEDLRQGLAARWENEQLTVLGSEETVTYALGEDSMLKEHPYGLQGFVLYRRTDGGRNQPMANYIGGWQVQMEGRTVNLQLWGALGDETISVKRTVMLGGRQWHLLY